MRLGDLCGAVVTLWSWCWISWRQIPADAEASGKRKNVSVSVAEVNVSETEVRVNCPSPRPVFPPASIPRKGLRTVYNISPGPSHRSSMKILFDKRFPPLPWGGRMAAAPLLEGHQMQLYTVWLEAAARPLCVQLHCTREVLFYGLSVCPSAGLRA